MSPFVVRVIAFGAERAHRLSRGRTVVGRFRDADIEITDPAAARRHCVLDWHEGVACHTLTVWGRNGVVLNGALLKMNEEQQLVAGAELRIGNALLKYENLTNPERERE